MMDLLIDGCLEVEMVLLLLETPPSKSGPEGEANVKSMGSRAVLMTWGWFVGYDKRYGVSTIHFSIVSHLVCASHVI